MGTELAYKTSCELTLTVHISHEEHLKGPQRKTVKIPTELNCLNRV